MYMLKRFAALVLSGMIAFSCVTASLSASAAEISTETSGVSVEEAVQAALNIAKDDSHGYSNENRWGPDYDCSSFVLTSLKTAGFNIGDAIGTKTMKHGLCMNGWKWYPWNQIKTADNLKRGDILLNEELHTEFYIGKNQNVGAHWDCGSPKTGDQSGDEISICGFYEYPWDGVLRYTNDIPKVKPSDLEITASMSACALTDEVSFDFFSINSAEQYIDIYKDGKRTHHINVTDKYHHSMKFTEGGTYTYSLIAKNIMGEVKSSEGKIRVYKDKPSDCKVSVDKSVYAAGETVLFNFNAKNDVDRYLVINQNGWWDNYNNVNGETQYKMKAEYGGTYYYFLSASNPAGTAETERKSFMIYDSAPFNLYVYADKYELAAGEYITFKFEGTYVIEQDIIIEKDGKQYYKASVTGQNDHAVQINDPGSYTYTLKARNKFGETSSYGGEFSVYNTPPENLYCWTETEICRVGEEVKIDTYSLYADEKFLRMTAPNGRTTILKAGADGEIKTSFSAPGKYTYSFGASNKFGETYTMKRTLLVLDSAPTDLSLDADKYTFVIGDLVHFTFDADCAQRMTISIDGEEEKAYEEDVTYTNEYYKYVYKAGQHTCILKAYNDIGVTEKKLAFNVTEGYTVKYDANGGNNDNVPPDDIKQGDRDLLLSGMIPEREGYIFLGWNPDKDAAAAQFTAYDYYPLNKSTVLYAIWVPEDSYKSYYWTVERWEWSEDHTSAKAIMTCDEPDHAETSDQPEKSVHVETAEAAVTVEEYPSNCGHTGERTYYAYLRFDGGNFYDEYKETIPELEHDYTLTSWKWDGIKSATATLECENNGEHIVTLNAEIKSEPSEDGSYIKYTATVTQDGKTYESSRTVFVGKLGDLDDDGNITSADALTVLRMSVGLEAVSGSAKTISDVDGDSTVTAADALEILRSSVGLSSNIKIGKPIE